MATVLALAGFMGSGKTSVGRRAADLLGWQFIDLDDRVVLLAGRDIPEIFATEGEDGFRRRECDALRDIMTEDTHVPGRIVALGGGTLTTSEAVACLHEGAVVVYLEVDADEAWPRVQGTARPLARDRESFAALLAERRRTYEHAADHRISVAGRTPAEIAEEVAAIARASTADEAGRW